MTTKQNTRIKKNKFNDFQQNDYDFAALEKELLANGSPQPNPEDKGDKKKQINDLLKQAEEGTRAVFESEKYKNFLRQMAKFHHYSFRNTMLIILQKPNATCVAGYTSWQKNFRRQVQKGERGIKILAYAPKKVSVTEQVKDQNGNVILDPDGQPETRTVLKTIPAYKPAYVFDVSQTQGEPLPTLVTDLTGTPENYEALLQALTNISDRPIIFDDIDGSARGYCKPDRICIQKDMSPAQTIKTLVHEITHADLHYGDDAPERHTKEIEAESTAYVVCDHYGIDTSDYSFPYLASWSSSKELSELQNSLDRIQKQAEDMIDKLDEQLKELLQDRSIENLTEYPDEASPFRAAGSTIKLDETGNLTSTKRNMKDVANWTEKDVALFAIENDLALYGVVQEDTLKTIQEAGFTYQNGHLASADEKSGKEAQGDQPSSMADRFNWAKEQANLQSPINKTPNQEREVI